MARNFASLVFSALLLAGPLPALATVERAPVLVSITGSELQDMGYKADLGTDSVGDPLLTSAADGAEFQIFFFECDTSVPKECGSLMFRAGYDLPNGIALETVNAWNVESRLGRAWVDEDGDPFLEMNVNVMHGVTPENLRDTIDWWIVSLTAFHERIG